MPLRRITCALAFAVTVGSGAAAQTVPPMDTVVVHGHVLYRPSGRPVAGGWVLVDGLGIRGGLDAEGRYTLRGPLPERFDLVVWCPLTRRAWGRMLDPVPVARELSTDSAATISIPERACREPPEERRVVEVEGLFRAGFELSALRPCEPFADLAGTAYDLPDQEAWVEFGNPVPDLGEPTVHEDVGGNGEARWFLRVRGTLRGPGGYGHLGFSVWELTVDTVLEVRPPTTDDCARR